jgi:aryl-alcohol dehydrogenase-like predicted oxidoreductase
MGSMSKEESFKLLDAYLETGGNCLNTAQCLSSEYALYFSRSARH